jgi:ferrous iron transport protein B
MKILLVGNPNVGKSVLFSRLTGTRTIASNYPGTTVGFTKGNLRIGEERRTRYILS